MWGLLPCRVFLPGAAGEDGQDDRPEAREGGQGCAVEAQLQGKARVVVLAVHRSVALKSLVAWCLHSAVSSTCSGLLGHVSTSQG